MRTVFADPKTDFVFKRIFGSEAHKPLLVALLEALLEVNPAHRIVDLEFLTPEQHLPIEEFKLSIVDVKCRDASGRYFVVEMQVLNVEGFEKRVVYNSAKAYVGQLRSGESYPTLADVIGVTICDFEVWPDPPVAEMSPVPMLSRWRMQEQHGGALGLSQIQHVFLELPKYRAGDTPVSVIDRWTYFFREAENFQLIPPPLAEGPFREALEVARIAGFDPYELELYDRGKIAEQDARGALSLSRREGREEGLAEGLRTAIRTACHFLDIALGPQEESRLSGASVAELESLRDSLVQHRRWPT
jgi:predicted transposase/invertase (TIGR01784 family)